MPESEQTTLRDAIPLLLAGTHLTSAQARSCVSEMMSGTADPVLISAWLTAMTAKGPAGDELSGAAEAMREKVTPIRTERSSLVDTCGTGGDGLHTFNISTATAIVAAACHVNIAKHGNRSVSSRSGSADVLEQLGLRLDLSAEAVGRCLDDVGIAFCFAPLLHSAMKHVGPVRKALGIPTIFNLLGPLTNPAGAEYQLLGAADNHRAVLLAEALKNLGCKRALVVCGNNELDEVCLWGPTRVWRVEKGTIQEKTWTPMDFGLSECRVDQLQVESSDESAAVIREAFDGALSPAADVITANAAAALIVAGKESDAFHAARRARDVLYDGTAKAKLQELAEWTQRHGSD